MDLMDLDSDAQPDDIHRKDNDQNITRARRTSSGVQKRDCVTSPEKQQEEFASITHEGQNSGSPKQTTANKQKMLLADRLSIFLGGSSGQRDDQQGHHGVNVEELCARLQDSLAEIDALRQANEGIKKEKRKAERKINDLKYDSREVQKAKESLEQQLAAEEEAHREEAAQLNSEITNRTHANYILRQMNVPVSEKQTPDSEMVSKFTRLCSSILGLVRQTWRAAPKKDVDLKHLTFYQQDFFRSPFQLSYDRLRCLVFQKVHEIILGPRNYFLGEGFEQLEQHIQMLEKELNMNSSGEERVRVMEWRNATFNATEKFRDNGIRLSSTAQDDIWTILSPFQTKDATAEQNGRKKLKTICDNAVELSLMMRQLKDEFKVEMLARALDEPISQWDAVAEDVLFVLAQRNYSPGTIAYVIIGALIKSPKENLMKDLVLEKAQVAVFQ